MIFLINFFKFFQLTIQKPEISLQPHILKNEKHIKESGDKEITLFNNVKNIEFIINFKTYDILDCYVILLLGYKNMEH